jgi:hypothetical protein
MIKKGLYDRYVPDVNIHSDNMGNIHRGHDSLLKRDILIYREPWKPSDSKKHSGEPKESGVRFTGQPFVLQILDRGVEEQENYYVLEYIPGLLLKDAVNEKKLSLKETLGMAVQFVQMLGEARQDGLRGIVLSETNLWLTEEGEIKLINSWTTKPGQTKEIEGILRLMHLMMFGQVEIRLPVLQVIEEIALSFQGNPYIVRKSLKAMIRREEKKSSERYEEMLKQTLEDFTSLYQYVKRNQVTTVRKEAQDPVFEAVEEMPGPAWYRTKKLPVKYLAIIGLLIVISMTAFSFLSSDKGQTSGSPAAVTDKVGPVQEKKATGIEVPDVSGLSLEEAGSKLDAAGVRYKYYLESSIRKKGTVLKQSPGAGEFVRRTDIVSLWVSE